MSFGEHAILWLHVAAAVFTIGPGTAAIMSTPRYIRRRNPVIVGFLLRTTRIYAFGTLLVLVFGLILTAMEHKFSQWWVSASLTLFVVAFVLLMIILHDQRRALGALDAAAGAAVADAVEEPVQPEDGPAATVAIAAPVSNLPVASVERGRISAIGGVTALIWIVVLVFMVWQ